MDGPRMKALTLVVGVLLAACTGSGDTADATTTSRQPTDAPTTTQPAEEVTTTVTSAPATTTTEYAGPTNPFDTVVNWYAALNDEDVDALAQLWPSGDRTLFSLLTAGLDVRVSVSCFPGEQGEGSVRCQEDIARNAFYTPAGLAGSWTMLFTVEEGTISAVELVDKDPSHRRYEEAFGEWLQEAHPDVYESSYSGEGWYPFSTVDQASEVLALIDDFLAESDDYPLDR